EDGLRVPLVTGVQTCALPICRRGAHRRGALGRCHLLSRVPRRKERHSRGTARSWRAAETNVRAWKGVELISRKQPVTLKLRWRRSQERRAGRAAAADGSDQAG